MQVVTYAVERLVKRHVGTMPILLTAPHGGSERPPDVDPRTRQATPSTCTGRDKFVVGRDDRTAQLTEAVAKHILSATGLSPYVVIAQFGREFIDSNRSEGCAFTDPRAKPFYDEYHGRIERYVDQILAQNQGRGFLFDIHGSGVQTDPADIFLGTIKSTTLQSGFGRGELFSQHGLQGLIRRARFTPPPGTDKAFRFDVSPRTVDDEEFPGLSGAHTVKHYGGRVNAIQIETTSPVRNDPVKFGFLAEALANAMIHSVRRYAPF